MGSRRFLQQQLLDCVGEEGIAIMKADDDGNNVFVKNRILSFIKRDIRMKAMNDKYRCQFLYQDLQQCFKLVETMALQWKIFKYDLNIQDATSPNIFKLYALFDVPN